MKIDLIITTCTGDPLAWPQRTPSRTLPAKARADLLIEKILPAAVGFDEVIMVGRIADEIYEAFPDITYIHLPALKRDRVEAFRQREAAARWSNADVFVLSADDHMLGEGFVETLRGSYLDKMAHKPSSRKGEALWDIITPQREHGITGAIMNNGKSEGYSPWHTQVIPRYVWAQLPFTGITVPSCDIVYSRIYKELGFKMIWPGDLVTIDVEATEEEI